MIRKPLPWLAVALCCAHAAHAAPAPFDLGSIEVTGESGPAAARATAEGIDADALADWHVADLGAALDRLPGVSLQDAGQRRERLISIRGFSSRQIPLFIDGVPVYVPYDGVVDFSRFGVDYVSEVVVSKGLASVLYGPNILGGAINVISRRPTAPFEASASTSFEFDDRFDDMSQRATVSVGGLRGSWYAHVTASIANADGYRLPSDFTPVSAEDGARRENAESRDTVISAKIGYVAGNGDEYALSLYRQDGEKQVPPYAGSYLRSGGGPADGVQVRWWQWPDWNKQSLYFTARNGITDKGTLRWRLFHDRFYNELDSYDDATYTTQTRPYAFADSIYDDDTYGGNADFEWRWNSAHVSRVAVHGRQDIHRESDRVTPRERLEIPTWDIAAEHEWAPAPGWTLTPGYAYLRQSGRSVEIYEDDQYVPVRVDAADAHNGQLVVTWSFAENRSVFAGVSRKTRFPTLKERFSGGLGSAVPNPALGPETALHYEAGYRVQQDSWGLRLAVFHAEIDDAIESVSIEDTACGVPPCSQLRNIGEQRNRGVELTLDATPVPSVQLLAQMSLLDRDNLSSPEVEPIGTPEYTLRLAAAWQPRDDWSLRIDTLREGKRASNSRGTRVADGFALVNAFVRHEPLPSLGLEIGVRNLADRLYAYDEGFYQPGRSFIARIDWRYGS